ncbi:uncharacterized protein OCT59_011820 [Rhizophagus irregularis]|uniref:uncharacterized protein n=1 Tax=Rhizophagus irregularis TaxID=588596 RepID=UPI00332EF514|nr:hypothetical protein OCT59_011820 [Rhizophagus irregularis]
MEKFMLNDDVFEQIKDFNHWNLTEEQSLLIDKLILNEEFKKRYKENGSCKECKQPRASRDWCQCKFQQNFKNWTSGNHEVDNLIQKVQLKAKDYQEVLEWIEYDRFENVEYLAKGGFGTIYKAIWKDGLIDKWDFENNKWIRSKFWFREYENFPVVLKCLHNSQDITSDFLREIETHIMIPYTDLYYSSSDHEIKKQIEEADKINEKLTSSSSLYTGPTLSYTTNPQAIYTSRLLDFKNLPEQKNAIDNKDDDNSFGEYSESIEAIDFTKLDLDKI